MIGLRYWSTGITCRWTPEVGGGRGPGWGASLEFVDDGFCNHESTEGRLTTRYYVPGSGTEDGLSVALDILIRDAGKLGIEFRGRPSLYVKGDGESDEDLPPGWRFALARAATRLGWANIYGGETVTVQTGETR